jgi:hypothetical protein
MGTRHHGALVSEFGLNKPSDVLLQMKHQQSIYGENVSVDGGKLARFVQTNALSSHISSLRALLEIEQRKPADQRVTQAKGVICERRTVGGKPRFFYRLEY